MPDRFLEARAAIVLGCVQILHTDRAGAAGSFKTAHDLFAEVGAPGWQDRSARLLAALGDGETWDSDRLFALVRP